MARAARRSARALVEIKAVDDTYPLYGTVVTDPDRAAAARCSPRAATSSGRWPIRRCWRGSTSSRATGITRRARPRSRSAPRSTGEPDKLARRHRLRSAPADQRGGAAGDRTVQPGSLVRWHYRVRLPGGDIGDAAVQARDRCRHAAIARCRLGNPQPQQCLAAAGSSDVEQFTPISDAGRPDRAAGRRRRGRQCDPGTISTASATRSPP